MGAVAVAEPTSPVSERFGVGGMTCGACVHHVEQALRDVPGVHAASVDLAAGTVDLRRDPSATRLEVLREAVAAAGYTLAEAPTIAPPVGRPVLRALAVAALAAAGLLAFYLGVITLAQGWSHATQQLAEDRWFVLAIMAGFGTQAGLFAYLRGQQARAGSAVAASTGTSAAAMLACCAHHVADLVPVLGLSGAAIFLNAYKTPLLWLGIGMNLIGVAYLLWRVRAQRQMACHVADEPAP